MTEGVRGYALDPNTAEALWKKSEQLVRESFWFSSLQTTNSSRRNEMIGQINLAGSFTLHGTSMTVNRMGYGAMQLAGRDGNRLV